MDWEENMENKCKDLELFDIEKIVNYLRKYKPFLKESYIWNTPSQTDLSYALENGIIDGLQFNKLISETNSFKRNVILKKVMYETICLASNVENKKAIYKWIVSRWGGINVRDIDKLYNTVTEFLQQSSQSNTLKLDNIASISKVLSFTLPEKYIIYDARVAFAMNWILLRSNASEIFFPMPESRNSKLNAIDISTLIRLSQIEKYIQKIGTERIISNVDKSAFVRKSKAYIILCELINEVNTRLWEDDRKQFPFYTEMLIFSLADTEIFSDILNSCRLSIN